MNSNDFCPECGTGTETRNQDGTITVRCPRGFPFDDPCKACKDKTSERFAKLGQKAAERINRNLLESLGKCH